MRATFGARLRTHRERQQIALATVAEQTKIKVSLLEGLERDDVSRWPGGIFRRAYVRAYARAIGLEPDPVVREFLGLFPDPDDDSPDDVVRERGGPPPTRLSFLINSAIGALPALRGSSERTDPAARTVAPAPDLTGEPQQPPEPQISREPPRPEPPLRHIELSHVAKLCTRLARATASVDVAAVLEEAAAMLNAVGVVLWTCDPAGRALRPVLSHGYPGDLRARVPHVSCDADNVLAAAYRSREMRVIEGGAAATGCVAAPLVAPTGCAGVLALEWRHGEERHEPIRAAAAILAAQLSTLVGHAPLGRGAGITAPSADRPSC